MVTSAEVAAGSTVLDIGCGTGQLSESLARLGFNLTAIDIGPPLIAAARRRLDGAPCRLSYAYVYDGHRWHAASSRPAP